MPPRFIAAHVYGVDAEGPIFVTGPDGRRVWWKPPAGYKVGDDIASCDPESGVLPIVISVYSRGVKAPTTAIGPDGRLVWLEPPAGCKAGDPII